MQKFYEQPKMEIVSSQITDDVITTSPGLGTETGGSGNEHQFGN